MHLRDIMQERLSSVLDYLKFLLTNPYFWGGAAVLLLVGILLAVTLNSAIMPSVTRHNEYVSVPNVINYTYEDAESALELAGLEVEQVMRRYSPDAPRDAVVDQNPVPSARVKPGRRVYLTVNSGRQAMVRVPRLTDLSTREATSRLSAIGLRAGELRPDSIPSQYANTITRQLPQAGDSLAEGGEVRLWYSTGFGSESVMIPDVTGMTVSEAASVLLGSRLRYVVLGEEGVDDPSATVQRQSREPGTRVREGFEIRLFVGEDTADEGERIEY